MFGSVDIFSDSIPSEITFLYEPYLIFPAFFFLTKKIMTITKITNKTLAITETAINAPRFELPPSTGATGLFLGTYSLLFTELSFEY
jgi:hypothetical protein